MKATARDLRFYTRELLESVRRGEEVIITYRGKPCAKLVPLEGTKQTGRPVEHPLFGLWQDYREVEEVDDYIRKIRRGRF